MCAKKNQTCKSDSLSDLLGREKGVGAGGAGGEGGGPSFIPSEINKLCVIIKMKTSICVRVIFFATKSVTYLAKKNRLSV